MTHYSIQPRDIIFVKGYRFLYGFMSKNNGKILSLIYSQKILNHTKQPAIEALKTASKREI